MSLADAIGAQPTTRSGQKTARLEIRLRPEQKELLERAAALQGASLTDFATASLETAAAHVVRRHQTIVLSALDSRAFFEALFNPPQPDKRLVNALERHRERLGR
ncbi:MAG: type II toxin-antitoxin system TacA family antitoxin [Thermoleophilia bacterium]